MVEEDDPDILYRDRPYRHLTIIRRLPHLHLLEAQGEVGRIADIDRSLHHGSRGASEQRDPSEEVDTDLIIMQKTKCGDFRKRIAARWENETLQKKTSRTISLSGETSVCFTR